MAQKAPGAFISDAAATTQLQLMRGHWDTRSHSQHDAAAAFLSSLRSNFLPAQP